MSSEPTPESSPYTKSGSPSLTPEVERTWALTAHAIAGAAMVLSAGTLGFVAALVIYLVYKDRGPFVRQHAADAVNIQLNALLWFIVGGILVLVLVGFAVLAVVPIVAVVLHILGAVKAYQGEWHWSPLTIKFVQ
jgi:uncharacterized Tic20 family protein